MPGPASRARRASALSLVLAALVAIAAQPAGGDAGSRVRKRTLREERVSHVPGELVVAFRPGVRRAGRLAVHALHGARVVRRLGGGVELVRLPAGVSAARGLAAYARDPAVAFAEPNLVRHLADHIPILDPRFEDQWAHQNTGQPHELGDCPASEPACMAAGTPDADADTPTAWDTTKGDPGTVIAIMDNGVDVMQPDILPNLWTNDAELVGLPGTDDDGNGYVDDVHGCDFADGDCSDPSLLNAPDPQQEFAHGTHVAGIAGADDNPSSVVGACPDCSLMVLKIADEDGALTLAAELAAFAYAERMGAHIVNASFGGSEWSRAERDAIAALGDRGGLVVVAAGNCGLDNDLGLTNGLCGSSPSFPASYTLPNILAVAASNHRDEYGYLTRCEQEPDLDRGDCLFTNWGHNSVDVAAPGVDILSDYPGGLTITFSGTSMAAPFVAGVAGLVRSLHPAYRPEEIRHAIVNGADRPETMDDLTLFGSSRLGLFTVSGDGRVNANGALAASTADLGDGTDDTIEGARRIRRARRGFVSWPNDVNDVFRRTLRRGRYRVFLDGPPGRDLDLLVWKPGTTEIWQFEAGCLGVEGGPCRLRATRAGSSADETIASMRILRRGIFYFHVSAFLFERGSYRLVVRRLGRCDPSYPTVCIPPPPPDLDCADIPERAFPVRGPDVHRLDRDRDGVACEPRD